MAPTDQHAALSSGGAFLVHDAQAEHGSLYRHNHGGARPRRPLGVMADDDEGQTHHARRARRGSFMVRARRVLRAGHDDGCLYVSLESFRRLGGEEEMGQAWILEDVEVGECAVSLDGAEVVAWRVEACQLILK